jgi:hypothetical protein
LDVTKSVARCTAVGLAVLLLLVDAMPGEVAAADPTRQQIQNWVANYNNFRRVNSLTAQDKFAPMATAAGPGVAGEIAFKSTVSGRVVTAWTNGFDAIELKQPSLAGGRVTLPSSVLSETVGATATATDAGSAAAAASNEVAAGSGFFTVPGSKLVNGAAGAITTVQGLAIGVSIGQTIDSLECHFGVDALCMPKDPQYIPNGDIGAAIQPGFPDGQVDSFDIGTAHYTVLMQWANGIEPAAGATDVPNPPAGLRISVTSSDVSQTPSSGYSLTALCSDTSNAFSSAKPYYGYGYSQSWGIDLPAGSAYQSGQSYLIPLGTSGGGATLCLNHGGFEGLVSGVSLASGFHFGPAWYAVGNSHATPGSDPDPARKWRTSVTCSDGSTGIADSADFHETDATIPAYPDAPPCGPGTHVTKVTISELGGPATRVVSSYTVPQAIQDWESGPDADKCAAGGCVLGLEYNQNGSWVDCYSVTGLCVDWFSDPNKSTDYQCTYGPAGTEQVVALSECNVLSPAFDPAESAKGVTAGDPRTGEIPSGNGQPESGGGTLPSGGGPGCWPSGGWSSVLHADPLSWVYLPVLCALKAAFVPDTASIMPLLDELWDSLQSKPPFSLIAPAAGFVSGFFVTMVHGCEGNLVDYGNSGLVVPCEPPGPIKPFIDLFKVVATIGFAIIAGFDIWRYVENAVKR